jgi:hypothetical protein
MRVKAHELRKNAPPANIPAMVRVAGIDISLSNLGLVKFDLDSHGELKSVESKLVHTKPEPKKAHVRKNSDDLNRASAFAIALREFLVDCEFVFVELPVGSQSARAMASYGISVGLIASLVDYPLILVLPSEVKMVVNDKTASKQKMIAWATKQFPKLNWKMHGKKFTNDNEHMADACASVVAGMDTQDFKRALTLAGVRATMRQTATYDHGAVKRAIKQAADYEDKSVKLKPSARKPVKPVRGTTKHLVVMDDYAFKPNKPNRPSSKRAQLYARHAALARYNAKDL